MELRLDTLAVQLRTDPLSWAGDKQPSQQLGRAALPWTPPSWPSREMGVAGQPQRAAHLSGSQDPGSAQLCPSLLGAQLLHSPGLAASPNRPKLLPPRVAMTWHVTLSRFFLGDLLRLPCPGPALPSAARTLEAACPSLPDRRPWLRRTETWTLRAPFPLPRSWQGDTLGVFPAISVPKLTHFTCPSPTDAGLRQGAGRKRGATPNWARSGLSDSQGLTPHSEGTGTALLHLGTSDLPWGRLLHSLPPPTPQPPGHWPGLGRFRLPGLRWDQGSGLGKLRGDGAQRSALRAGAPGPPYLGCTSGSSARWSPSHADGGRGRSSDPRVGAGPGPARRAARRRTGPRARPSPPWHPRHPRPRAAPRF